VKTTEIKIWLLKNGYRQTDIARDLGVTPQVVWQAIHGVYKNRRVEGWLLKHGCPPELLGIDHSKAEKKVA